MSRQPGLGTCYPFDMGAIWRQFFRIPQRMTETASNTRLLEPRVRRHLTRMTTRHYTAMLLALLLALLRSALFAENSMFPAPKDDISHPKSYVEVQQTSHVVPG
ncbi:uncharacterized protein B0I36DRAFT_365151 [Microdochium trichocladiopsis]|uniref:Uncharacterized protein n=1 Tax=Microdochium trichocladiopsis TaxID=1682393 RepID=A0A9P9BNS3_9PEZI|nr:uncharacterized protein B0I36DRAFT_365151 [Microdochium trichocladiopsis]KAH7028031.1 hypothetical protein B0I36DRAFT_365151 [Microdochium trichocladiopsis]